MSHTCDMSSSPVPFCMKEEDSGQLTTQDSPGPREPGPVTPTWGSMAHSRLLLQGVLSADVIVTNLESVEEIPSFIG